MQLGPVTTLDQDAWKLGGEDEKEVSELLESLQNKNVYVLSYTVIPYLQFYTGYSKGYDGPYGYRGETKKMFIDLHSVQDISTIEEGYVVIDKRYTNAPDEIQFYNNALPYINTNVQEDWEGLFVFTNQNGEYIGGIWEVKK